MTDPVASPADQDAIRALDALSSSITTWRSLGSPEAAEFARKLRAALGASPAEPEKNPNVHFASGAPSEGLTRDASGDWPGDREPGGMECMQCGRIFIGAEYRNTCKPCAPTEKPKADDLRELEIESGIACLGDDAASLRDKNPECEIAANMDHAAELLAALAAALPSQRDAPTDEEIEAIFKDADAWQGEAKEGITLRAFLERGIDRRNTSDLILALSEFGEVAALATKKEG